jgi:hypothetical protein
MWHKWSRLCFVRHNHNPVLSSFMTYHRCCNKSTTTGATCTPETAYLRTTRVHARFLVWFVMLDVSFSVYCFVDSCLSLFPFSFGHCIVCPSPIYGFWLLLWNLHRAGSVILSKHVTHYGPLTGFPFYILTASTHRLGTPLSATWGRAEQFCGFEPSGLSLLPS